VAGRCQHLNALNDTKLWNCHPVTAVFSLEFSNKIYSIKDESIFPIPESENNQPDSIIYVHFPFSLFFSSLK
jgi:hypothetical protein